MKKRISILIGLTLAGFIGTARADTNTTRLGLTKPSIGSTNWGPKINTNMDSIDSGVALQGSTNDFTTAQRFSGGVVISSGVSISSLTAISSSMTVQNSLGISGEFKPGLTSSTSGQILTSQGAAIAPKYQWDGRINGPDSYSITATTSTIGTTTLGANTSLTGTHTTLTAGEKVEIKVSGSCQAAASDGGSMGLKRDTTNVSGGTAGAFRMASFGANAGQTACGFVLTDTPGSVGTFTYTVTFNSTSGGTFQFGETNRASWMIITGYPK